MKIAIFFVISTIVAIRPPLPPVYDKGDALEKQRNVCTCKQIGFSKGKTKS